MLVLAIVYKDEIEKTMLLKTNFYKEELLWDWICIYTE